MERAHVERLETAPPGAPQGPAIQQMSVDGVMVPLVGREWAEVKTLAIGEVWRTPGGGVQTTALSYCSRLCDATQFTRWARGETERRGTETAGVVCAVGDGAEWLQPFVDHHRPDAVRILDFPHAAQRVCAAAQAVWGAGTAATSAWLDDQLHCLKHGDPTAALVALRALPVADAPSPAEAALTRETVLAYLTTRWEQIQYARFRAAGYPIGSGIVESANKLVVEGRLKEAGCTGRGRTSRRWSRCGRWRAATDGRRRGQRSGRRGARADRQVGDNGRRHTATRAPPRLPPSRPTLRSPRHLPRHPCLGNGLSSTVVRPRIIHGAHDCFLLVPRRPCP